MNYQAIRAAVEGPILTAFNDLTPEVPVYFDNITAVPPNTTTEYVRVNVTFGLTTEPTLTTSLDSIRGAIVIRIYTEKGRGPARNQELITTAVTTLKTIQDTGKTASGVFFSIGQIDGPFFSTTEASPHFVGQIETGYVATDLS